MLGNFNDFSSCLVLNKNIYEVIKNKIGHEDYTYFSYMNRSNAKSYDALIKYNESVVFFSGFSDFGGGDPSEEEKNVCDLLAK